MSPEQTALDYPDLASAQIRALSHYPVNRNEIELELARREAAATSDQRQPAPAADKRIAALKMVLNYLPRELDRQAVDTEADACVEIVDRALTVLGSPERLTKWMRTPVASLGGRMPWALLQTREGRTELDTVLGRIAHGIY